MKTNNESTPSFGPMIDWNYNCNSQGTKNNSIRIIKYIANTIKKYEHVNKNMILSRMEINDFIDILAELKIYDISNSYGNLSTIELLQVKIKKLQEIRYFIEDEPSSLQEFESRPIYKERFRNRPWARRVYSSFQTMKEDLYRAMKFENTGIIVSLKGQLTGKRYLDKLIDLKIFRYEDIYGNMFDSEKVFDDLSVFFEQFKAMHIKLNGKLPKWLEDE